MSRYDNTDLEFAYSPKWASTILFLLFFGLTGVIGVVKMTSHYTAIHLGEFLNTSERLGYFIWMGLAFLSGAAAVFLLYRAFRNLKHPQTIYVNSQRIKLPRKTHSRKYTIIFFRDVSDIQDDDSAMLASLTIKHKRGRTRILKSVFGKEQEYTDLRELIQKFQKMQQKAQLEE